MPAAKQKSKTTPAEVIARLVDCHFDANVKDAARAIGCSYDLLWRVCSGRQRSVRLDLAIQVAAYFEFTLDELFGGEP